MMTITNRNIVHRHSTGRLNILLLAGRRVADGQMGTRELPDDIANLIGAACAGEHDLVETVRDIRTVADLKRLYANAMSRVATGKLDIIVIGKLPMVFRDTRSLLRLVFACQDRSTRCVVPSMAVDTTAEAGDRKAQAARRAAESLSSCARRHKQVGT